MFLFGREILPSQLFDVVRGIVCKSHEDHENGALVFRFDTYRKRNDKSTTIQYF